MHHEKSFMTSYAGKLGPKAPSWQLQDYEVCFWDPDVFIQNMLDNPDFNGHFDYAPYIDLGSESLSNVYFFCNSGHDEDHIPKRFRWKYTMQMQWQKVQCIAVSFWVQTKPQSQWQPEMLSTTLCTSQFGMSTTLPDVLTEMQFCQLDFLPFPRVHWHINLVGLHFIVTVKVIKNMTMMHCFASSNINCTMPQSQKSLNHYAKELLSLWFNIPQMDITKRLFMTLQDL